MAITNFIPEVWDASLLQKIRNTLVYGSLCNRNYEGDIARAGDTVHITSVLDPQVRSYTRNAGATTPTIAGITYDLLTDATQTFAVDQADYFAFQVDDIDKRQALPGFVEEATTGAGYNLASKVDAYLSAAMVAGVPGGSGTDVFGQTLPNNKLGAITVGAKTGESADTTPVAVTGAYEMLVALRTKLTRSNAPVQGRWVVVPPEVYAFLLQDERFVRVDESGTDQALRNGMVGRAAGFDVIESNVVPFASGAYTVLAGTDDAVTFAQQILSTEALRLQTGFSDAVRGLHVYGAKVLDGRQGHLASAVATPFAGTYA